MYVCVYMYVRAGRYKHTQKTAYGATNTHTQWCLRG